MEDASREQLFERLKAGGLAAEERGFILEYFLLEALNRRDQLVELAKEQAELLNRQQEVHEEHVESLKTRCRIKLNCAYTRGLWHGMASVLYKEGLLKQEEFPRDACTSILCGNCKGVLND